MPSNPLDAVLQDIGPFQAIYKPAALVDKPAVGCDVPPKVPSRLALPALPVINPKLDCNLNFVQVPVVVPPFIPPFEDITVPCPDGFHFEAQFVPANSQCFTQDPTSSNGRRALLFGNIVISDMGVSPETEEVLPDIHIYIPIASAGTEAGGENTFPIVSGLRYVVNITGYDPVTMPDTGVVYFNAAGTATVYKHGQTFKGLTGRPLAAVNQLADNSITAIKNVQHKRVVDYDRTVGGHTLYIEDPGFTLPSSNYSVCDYVLHRLVISADRTKESGGGLKFVQGTCGGKLIGDINLNFDDLNIPCAEGFTFDAGYASKTGETLTVTGTDVVGTGIDLNALVPTGVSPESGNTYPLPILRVRTSTGPDVWVDRQVTAVTVTSGVAHWTIASSPGTLANGTYATWYLQRINVVSSGSTGGQLEYVRQGDCGGKLLGQISVNPPTFNLPCEDSIKNGGFITAGGNNNKITSRDRLRVAAPNTTGWSQVTGIDSTPVGLSKANSHANDYSACSYAINFDAAGAFNLPDIRIVLNLDSTEYRFARTVSAQDDVVTFAATIERGQLISGGSGGGTVCLNCCRWS